MTAYHLYRINYCKECGMETEYGSLCQGCRKRLKVKKNYEI